MLHLVSEYEPTTEGFESQFPIDLNHELIPHPNSTFLVRMDSDALVASNICKGDMLIVDRALTPTRISLCMIVLNEEFIIRWYNPKIQSIGTEKNGIYEKVESLQLFGTVTQIIRSLH